jgi:hypothetical protein
MATRVARRTIHNPGRLSDKQIKFFGTPAQKAALKRKRSRRRNAGSKRKAGSFRKRSSTKIHRPRTRPRHVKQRSNPGEILSLVANPAKRRKKVMAHRRRKRAASNPARRSHRRRRKASAPVARRRHRRRSNPSRVVYRTRRSHRRVGRRRNAGRSGGTGITGLFTNALWLVGGAVGTKVLTQAVLGAKNTGFMGYIGNAVAAFGLSLLVGKLLKNPGAGKQVLAGGIVALVLRLLSDYTPLGQYTSAIGMGDYQVSNWVTPQRYKDALNSAEVEIPAGWAPQVIQSNAAPGAPGMAAYGGSGGGLYTSGGLYST